MKIGILTQPLHNNYGGLLQNYALQQVLLRIGHAPITLDHNFSKKHPIRYVFLSQLKNNLLHFISPTNYPKPRYEYQPSSEELSIIDGNIRVFIERSINVTQKCLGENDFKKEVEERGIEALIVGSDQCWRPCYNVGYLYEMFLHFGEFLPLKKRIAYAASFGTDVWEYSDEQTKECGRLAQKFDLITVREYSGIDLCKNFLDVDSSQALDPTMLLDKEDYVSLICEYGEKKSNGSLFNYILDPTQEKTLLIEEIADSLKLSPFQVLPIYNEDHRTKKNVKGEIEKCVYPSPARFLRAFMDADMTIVDSFHGAVFSIIFNKPFWVIGNSNRGNARFESLLGMFGLEDRMITMGDKEDWNKEIDWGRVNDIRRQEKERCIELLKKSL